MYDCKSMKCYVLFIPWRAKTAPRITHVTLNDRNSISCRLLSSTGCILTESFLWSFRFPHLNRSIPLSPHAGCLKRHNSSRSRITRLDLCSVRGDMSHINPAFFSKSPSQLWPLYPIRVIVFVRGHIFLVLIFYASIVLLDF